MNPDERAFELGRKNRAERPLVPSTLKGIGNFKAGTANRFLLRGNPPIESGSIQNETAFFEKVTAILRKKLIGIHQNLKILLRAATSLKGLPESKGNSLR